MDYRTYLKNYPDENGRFGPYGGAYLSDELKPAFEEISEAYQTICHSSKFINELRRIRREFQGRPTPVYHADRLSRTIGNCQIYLKREDLNHTGAHKINNALGQVLLAKRANKKKIIAETGAGQHGVATATVAALFNMDCTIYMGAVDVKRQEANVFRMKILGANVVPVYDGNATLKEAVDKALEDFVLNAHDTFYLLGSAVGPHPYPLMVREFQSIIGKEAKRQIIEQEGRLPDYVVACVGGGSNAIGLFHPFVENKDVNLIGVEPAGKGIDSDFHAASISKGEVNIIHGFKCYTLDENKVNVHSVAAGLDYPGVGPEHCYYKDTGRAKYVSVNDKEALEAFHKLSKLEGIIPAIESSHAIYYGMELASTLPKDKIVIINLSGRGDKDINQIMENRI
ncbi:MAG: tryptophan synthase subunit beta [Tissierellia bacterium]|nr:tryptophan synthase subunit beta [Tissierellia bacterium]